MGMGTRGGGLGTAGTGEDDEQQRTARLEDEAAEWLAGREEPDYPGDVSAAVAILAELCPDLDVAGRYWRQLLAGHVDGGG